jgi:hypothetical protein
MSHLHKTLSPSSTTSLVSPTFGCLSGDVKGVRVYHFASHVGIHNILAWARLAPNNLESVVPSLCYLTWLTEREVKNFFKQLTCHRISILEFYAQKVSKPVYFKFYVI